MEPSTHQPLSLNQQLGTAVRQELYFANARIPRRIIGSLQRACSTLFCAILIVAWGGTPVFGDELILDESASVSTTVGDFDVSTFVSSIESERATFLDDAGTISAGQLYSIFKKKGLKSVYDINLCLDVVKTTDVRADYALDSIELRIEDLQPEKSRERLFSLGDNSILLPGYEASDSKPEAQISIKLDYDFMQKFNENSTEKLKFEYVSGNGERNSLPVKIGVLTPDSRQSWSRFIFLTAFAGFWILVFFVLFRITTPKSHKAASPA